jgi:hypothetical protein
MQNLSDELSLGKYVNQNQRLLTSPLAKQRNDLLMHNSLQNIWGIKI